jgi:hypothetical protein
MSEAHTTPGDWLTVTEAALRAGKSERTVQRWCQRGVIGARLVTTPDGEAWKIDPATLPKASDCAQPVTPHSDTVTPFGAQVTPPKQGGDAIFCEGDAIRCADSERVTPQVTPFSEGDATGDAILKQGDATPKASDGAQIGAELSPLAARYVAQLESENGFLRSQIEEANRNAAELRAALREAQKMHAKALPAPGEDSTPPGEVTTEATASAPHAASNAAQIGAQKDTKPRRRRGWLGWLNRG